MAFTRVKDDVGMTMIVAGVVLFLFATPLKSEVWVVDTTKKEVDSFQPQITIGIKSIYFPFAQFCIFEITQLRNTIGLFGEISGYLSDHIDLCINGFYTIGYSYHAYKSWEEETLTTKFIYSQMGIAVIGDAIFERRYLGIGLSIGESFGNYRSNGEWSDLMTVYIGGILLRIGQQLKLNEKMGIKGEVGAVLGKSVGHIGNGERVINGPIYSYLDIAWYHFLK